MRRTALDTGADGNSVRALTQGLLVEAKQRAHHAFGFGAREVAFALSGYQRRSYSSTMLADQLSLGNVGSGRAMIKCARAWVFAPAVHGG
jgi:hypothetical protein